MKTIIFIAALILVIYITTIIYCMVKTDREYESTLSESTRRELSSQETEKFKKLEKREFFYFLKLPVIHTVIAMIISIISIYICIQVLLR
jgi:hypothetical protein